MQYPSTKHSSWKVRTVLTLLAFIFALSLIASVSSQDDRRRSRIRPRFRPKKRIEDSETAAVLAENNKNNDDGIVGSVAGSRATARQLRTRNRVRARRPTIVTPEPPALFDDDEVRLLNINIYYYFL